jgi:thiosulfate/3-mercaptopyruvate sulfurtransferase
MKRKHLVPMLVAVFVILTIPFVAIARDIAPIVSTDWLEKNLKNSNVVVLDIRKVEEYKAGHIPGAVNAVYGTWAMMKNGLRNELPANDDLFDAIGSAGIDSKSLVVVVGKVDAIPDRTDMTRVAWTLKYAGLVNIALLDGGYNKWTADKKATSLDAVKAKAKPYKGKVNANLFVNKEYVMSHLKKATIVDVREADFYQGKKKLDFVEKMGHIPGAKNLPTSSAYTKEGTFKDKAELATIAKGVVGTGMTSEIIAYCDTGKVCTAWAYLLTDVLGYKNVKDYDGSTEEWTKDPKAPFEM